MSCRQAIFRDIFPKMNVGRYSPDGIHLVINPFPSFFHHFCHFPRRSGLLIKIEFGLCLPQNNDPIYLLKWNEAGEGRKHVDELMKGISTNFISSLNTRQAHSLPANIFSKNNYC